MWALALAVYAGCKWLTWRAADVCGAPRWRHLAYLLFWPGLDAPAFLNAQATVERKPTGAAWAFAVAKLAIGLALFAAAAELVYTGPRWLAAWLGMVGIAMVLHFGIFDLLSLAWRTAGVNARPLMHWPLTSTSVSDFWSRRWNTAFRDLAHAFEFRPAARLLGAPLALAAVFLVSGLVHDLVISLPAGGGYGGPTLFFTVQACGIFFERGTWGKWLGIGRGPRGWLFTMLVLAIPLPLLFHDHFVSNIILPMLQAGR
jgi:alginate O-acetyltransferase complex protein AlgI